jgi:hypothetical protein
MKKINKCIYDNVEIKSVNEETRTLWHKISVEEKDLMGDIVRIDGIDTSRFEKKPGVLYGHLYTGLDPLPVIGENVGFIREGKSLYAGTKFLDPRKDQLSEKLSSLVNDLWTLNRKKLVGWSIGFQPLEGIPIEKGGGGPIGTDYKKSLLLEYSNVVIPANQGAINDMVERGAIHKGFADPYLQMRELRKAEFKKLQKSLQDAIEITRRATDLLKEGSEAESFYYREITEAEVEENKLRLAKRLFCFCKMKLNLPDLSIQWIVKADPNDPGAKCTAGGFYGTCLEGDSSRVLIRADTALTKIKIAIPHEVHHQWMISKYGFPKDSEMDVFEGSAVNFTREIWEHIWDTYQGEDGFIYWPV